MSKSKKERLFLLLSFLPNPKPRTRTFSQLCTCCLHLVHSLQQLRCDRYFPISICRRQKKWSPAAISARFFSVEGGRSNSVDWGRILWSHGCSDHQKCYRIERDLRWVLCALGLGFVRKEGKGKSISFFDSDILIYVAGKIQWVIPGMWVREGGG